MIKKIIFLLTLSFSILCAKGELEIRSDRFVAEGANNKTSFIGNVQITKERDSIRSDTLEVFFDSKKKPETFVAAGNVNFSIELEKGSVYKGKAQKITYDAKKKSYVLSGNVEITESKNGNKITGDKITLDKANQKAEVTSSENKPVKFIFNIDDENLR